MTNSLTRKHFEIVAAALREARCNVLANSPDFRAANEAITAAIYGVATELAATNTKFDRARFISAATMPRD